METSKEYQQLIEYGLDAKVAGRLDEIFKTGEESYHLTFDELSCDNHMVSNVQHRGL